MKLKDKILKLTELKSILTLLLTIFLCWGFAEGKIESKEFLILVTMCYNFFFNYQNNKKDNDLNRKE